MSSKFSLGKKKKRDTIVLSVAISRLTTCILPIKWRGWCVYILDPYRLGLRFVYIMMITTNNVVAPVVEMVTSKPSDVGT